MSDTQWTADILVVDDTVENLEFLISILQEQRYKVRPVTSGEAALLAVHSVMPDLILLDVKMPEMDGYEVCRRLKADPKTCDLPIIFVTALGEEQNESVGLELGAVDYITKPIKPAILIARVRNQLLLKQRTEELERLSCTDSLTCLANRRSFFDALEIEWRRSARSANPLSLIMMDLDFFKAYNDHYGHVAGDECLGRVGQTLCNAMKRAGDIAARYGGEEFVVLLPETDLEGAVKVAERLRNEIVDLDIKHARSEVADRLTLSVGVATVVPTTDESYRTLVHAADMALYEAKENGRNQVRTATH
jgi:diguanylate cyclase (GGDEF)-like protein